MNNEQKKSEVRTIGKLKNYTVQEQQINVIIGGQDYTVTGYKIPESPAMQNYANQQAMINMATPLVNQTLIDKAINGLSGLFTGGSSSNKNMKSMMSLLMSVFVTPDAMSVFGGTCSPEVTKTVISGAVMNRLKKEVPNIIPGFLVDKMFGGNDDKEVEEKKETTESSTRRLVI